MERDWRDGRIAELEELLAQQTHQVAELTRQIAELTERLAELTARLGRTSRNSHLPPSSDPPKVRDERKKDKKSKRERGGQPGHGGSRRELVAPEKVTKFVDLFPEQCGNCWDPLPKLADPKAKRYQFTELPEIQPHTTEWRRHAVCCGRCGYKTRAAYDAAQIPASAFGPRLISVVAMLTGVYHLGRRRAVQLVSDILGLRISLGALSAVEERVSDAVQPAVDEAWERAREGEVKHTDGTSWYQAGTSMSLWTIATTAVTVFRIVASGDSDTLRPLFGKARGILVSDRAKALNFWVMKHRQICWAHLIRKFVSFSERAGPAASFGRRLLEYTALMFEYWHDLKVGKLSRGDFLKWMSPLQQQMEALLEQIASAKIAEVSGSCADILVHREALWTFVEREDVEPTNNHAERELRGFVLWRKRSFGAQSERGNKFAENLMTVAHTARKQGKNVLAFLVACCSAVRSGGPTPSLLAPA